MFYFYDLTTEEYRVVDYPELEDLIDAYLDAGMPFDFEEVLKE